MHGSTIGDLNVYLKQSSVVSGPNWYRSGPQGDRWWKAGLEINSINTLAVRLL